MSRLAFQSGLEVTGQLLTTVADNPDRVRSEASFAHLLGVAPDPGLDRQDPPIATQPRRRPRSQQPRQPPDSRLAQLHPARIGLGDGPLPLDPDHRPIASQCSSSTSPTPFGPSGWGNYPSRSARLTCRGCTPSRSTHCCRVRYFDSLNQHLPFSPSFGPPTSPRSYSSSQRLRYSENTKEDRLVRRSSSSRQVTARSLPVGGQAVP